MGYLHIYTGNGKGKTTAAFGLALRHLYAGGTVFIGQFVKSMRYAECGIAHDNKNIVIEQFGRDCFISKQPEQIDVDMARAGLKRVAEVLESAKFSLVILDEITIALYYNLFSEAELLKIITQYIAQTEIVITGRYASQNLISRADLVTEMKEVKHYYHCGVLSRGGIDK